MSMDNCNPRDANRIKERGVTTGRSDSKCLKFVKIVCKVCDCDDDDDGMEVESWGWQFMTQEVEWRAGWEP